eukprot:SAG31_NODE_3972_length_3704_cov_2.551734_3_plen_743_part_00
MELSKSTRKVETADVWRMLLDPNFQPGPRPTDVLEYISAQANGQNPLSGHRNSQFEGWLFKECKERTDVARGNVADQWRLAAKGTRDLGVTAQGLDSEQLAKRGLAQKLRRRHGTLCSRAGQEQKQLRFHAYTILRQDGRGGFLEDKATVLYHLLDSPSAEPSFSLEMANSMHMFNTCDAAAQLSELMFTEQPLISDPGGRLLGVAPDAVVSHQIWGSHAKGQSEPLATKATKVMKTTKGVKLSKRAGAAIAGVKRGVKTIAKKTVKKETKSKVARKVTSPLSARKLTGPLSIKPDGATKGNGVIHRSKTSAPPGLKPKSPKGAQSSVKDADTQMPLETVLEYLMDEKFCPGPRPMLFDPARDGCLFKEERMARCHRRLQADRWKHSGGAKGARDLPAGGPPQLRRRYGTILPFGYRKAAADDKPRFRYRQYNRLFTDPKTGEVREDVDCVLFHVIVEAVVPNMIPSLSSKHFKSSQTVPKGSAKATRRGTKKSVTGTATVKVEAASPCSNQGSAKSETRKNGQKKVFRLCDIKRKRAAIQKKTLANGVARTTAVAGKSNVSHTLNILGLEQGQMGHQLNATIPVHPYNFTPAQTFQSGISQPLLQTNPVANQQLNPAAVPSMHNVAAYGLNQISSVPIGINQNHPPGLVPLNATRSFLWPDQGHATTGCHRMNGADNGFGVKGLSILNNVNGNGPSTTLEPLADDEEKSFMATGHEGGLHNVPASIDFSGWCPMNFAFETK